MSLTEAEHAAISAAGSTEDQTERGRAVAIVLSKEGQEREAARRVLAQSYLRVTTPSFHLIPRGEAMLAADRFEEAHAELARATKDFSRVSVESLVDVLVTSPAALAPLRMIAGVTYNELAVAVELATGNAVRGGTLRAFEREQKLPTEGSSRWERRRDVSRWVAEALIAIVDRQILKVPPAVSESFHSKLDKRDTLQGWTTVARDARTGVPYSALLYQRYVGGLWRQVQDAYSEVKGDALLELPLQSLLRDHRVPFWRSPPGAAGARRTAQRYGSIRVPTS